MNFYRHFNDARQLADTMDDWDDGAFTWKKAYVASAFAAVAYEKVPAFGLTHSKRVV